ncbi:hypothetical protein CVT26_015955 [Gymnopilus dilepis]|uniref:Uncharacterized protein n=1 Tax=Gymnopilus dilepis TaxID=231916 RepID=A0A409WAE8_9AGAR|nr:hypothetical protein CVT26_015955 [Gymnopilus dilepis]
MPSEWSLYSSGNPTAIDDGDAFVITCPAASINDIWYLNIVLREKSLGYIFDSSWYRGSQDMVINGKWTPKDIPSISPGNITILKSGKNYIVTLNGRNLGVFPTTYVTMDVAHISISTSNRQGSATLGPFRVAVFDGPAAEALAELYRTNPSAALAMQDRNKQLRRDVEERERRATEAQTAASKKEKDVQDREARVKAREEALQVNERNLKEREEQLQQGAGGATPTPTTDPNKIRPSDYADMQLYDQAAWPTAVVSVLGLQRAGTLQKEHQAYMDKWVKERGDSLSADAYDYLVYSFGVAWQRVLLDSQNVKEDERKKILEEVTRLVKGK